MLCVIGWTQSQILQDLFDNQSHVMGTYRAICWLKIKPSDINKKYGRNLA